MYFIWWQNKQTIYTHRGMASVSASIVRCTTCWGHCPQKRRESGLTTLRKQYLLITWHHMHLPDTLLTTASSAKNRNCPLTTYWARACMEMMTSLPQGRLWMNGLRSTTETWQRHWQEPRLTQSVKSLHGGPDMTGRLGTVTFLSGLESSCDILLLGGTRFRMHGSHYHTE